MEPVFTNAAQAIEHYQELLTYVKSAVTRNYSEKSINNMLDFIEKTAEDDAANKCMEEFYSSTLESFQSTNNERLWLKTNIKLAKLWLDQKNYGPLTEKLRELHKVCQLPDGTDDPSKGTYSMEIYALEILMYEETRNTKRMKVMKAVGKGVRWTFAKFVVVTGTLSTRTPSPIGSATSSHLGHHSTMWW